MGRENSPEIKLLGTPQSPQSGGEGRRRRRADIIHSTHLLQNSFLHNMIRIQLFMNDQNCPLFSTSSQFCQLCGKTRTNCVSESECVCVCVCE